MTRFTVNNNGCYGIEMPGGAKYNADRSGHMDVDDRHAAAVASSMQAKRQWLGVTPWAFEGAAEKVCARCHFTAFAFSETCPRCGTPLGAACES